MIKRTRPALAATCAATALFALAACSTTNEETAGGDTVFDTVKPDIFEWMKSPAILVFSKTRSYRHNEGIAAADLFFAQLALEREMGLFTTVNGAVFNAEQLALFDVVVFNNMTGDALSPQQEQAFQTWLEDGGALIALHGSGDSSHTDWPWYDTKVIGPEFIGHPMEPQFQEAQVVSLAGEHPILKGLPSEWFKVDEWYSFSSTEQLAGATPLLGLDESTYIPEDRRPDAEQPDLRMGAEAKDHPIAWARCIGNGRVVYSALGHGPSSYEDANYRQFLVNAFDWTGTQNDADGANTQGC